MHFGKCVDFRDNSDVTNMRPYIPHEPRQGSVRDRMVVIYVQRAAWWGIPFVLLHYELSIAGIVGAVISGTLSLAWLAG